MQSIAREVSQDISLILKIILYCENSLAPFECYLPMFTYLLYLKHCYSAGSEAVTTVPRCFHTAVRNYSRIYVVTLSI